MEAVDLDRRNKIGSDTFKIHDCDSFQEREKKQRAKEYSEQIQKMDQDKISVEIKAQNSEIADLEILIAKLSVKKGLQLSELDNINLEIKKSEEELNQQNIKVDNAQREWDEINIGYTTLNEYNPIVSDILNKQKFEISEQNKEERELNSFIQECKIDQEKLQKALNTVKSEIQKIDKSGEINTLESEIEKMEEKSKELDSIIEQLDQKQKELDGHLAESNKFEEKINK